MDKVIVSSKSSENNLRKIGIGSKFLPYPWPNFFPLKKKKQLVPKFLFFGNLAGLGSKSSILELFNNVYPLLKKEMGEGKFRIMLAPISKKVLKEIPLEKFPEVSFCGYVQKKLCLKINGYYFE